MNRRTLIFAVVILLGVFVAGRFSARRAGETHAPDETAATEWTCSMHPQIRQPNPGKCPICAMDLIPVAGGTGSDSGPRELTLSSAAQRLAEIAIEPVARRAVSRELRLVGKIAPEEIEYLMARGLNEEEAIATIVRGFLNVNIEGLPESLAAEIKRTVNEFSLNKGV